jgi:hypothetical protein
VSDSGVDWMLSVIVYYIISCHFIPIVILLDKVPTNVGVSLSLSQWKVLCSATQVVDDLIIRAKDGEPVDWRRRLRYHQSPSTDNSHQEALRTSWRMDIASYEDRNDPESLRIEITE